MVRTDGLKLVFDDGSWVATAFPAPNRWCASIPKRAAGRSGEAERRRQAMDLRLGQLTEIRFLPRARSGLARWSTVPRKPRPWRRAENSRPPHPALQPWRRLATAGVAVLPFGCFLPRDVRRQRDGGLPAERPSATACAPRSMNCRKKTTSTATDQVAADRSQRHRERSPRAVALRASGRSRVFPAATPAHPQAPATNAARK